jgi:erythromycin esterase-like protein
MATMTTTDRAAVRVIRELAQPLRGGPSDFDFVVEAIGDARLVLIGEASHGTHEFYRIRGEITKRLIRDHGFTAVAVEADWPDAYRVNRYVRGHAGDTDADDALSGFKRFPQWMWRNADVLDFVGWLRAHNDGIDDPDRNVGFYGLDLYSLHTSMAAVLTYLQAVDPDAARRARERYACFDLVGGDPQEYGYAALLGITPSCERDVVAQLLELQRSAGAYAALEGRLDPDAQFAAERNAQLVVNAEQYYRAMFQSRVASWNLRDAHMAATLEALEAHLTARQHRRARIVVWAHNSHLGDARATEVRRGGEHNVGQLVRVRHGSDAALIGFTTHAGTVTAAEDWGAPALRMRVRPSLPDSYEALFHEALPRNFAVLPRQQPEIAHVLATPRLERAIGVIYRPDTERLSHYFQASLSRQFDVVLHYDTTRAVEPLERTARWAAGEPELPDTYPSAL